MLCYILNAKYIEPYDFLQGMLYTTDREVLAVTGGKLPNRPVGKYSMVIKTHDYPARNVNLTDKLIFLTRDPRDIAVSAYYRYRTLATEHPQHSIKLRLFFALHGVRSLSYAFTAYKWRHFMRVWLGRTDLPLYRVRYEDVVGNTRQTLEGILDYLGVKAEPTLIDEAIARFSFENLSGRRSGEERADSMAFRKGIVGDHRSRFSSVERRLFNVIAGAELDRTGYGR